MIGREYIIRRRAFLGAAALLCAGAATAARPFFKRHKLPIGVQIYTVLAEAQKDLDGTLAALARIGYREVELAGYLGRTPAEFRSALDRAGLKCASSHIPSRMPRAGPTLEGDLGRLAEDCHILGCPLVVMPLFYIPQRFALKPLPGEDGPALVGRLASRMTSDDWKWNADYLNAKAAILRRHGIRLGYHNHNMEFARFGGETAFDILLSGTDAKLVEFELDVGWTVAAGIDPVALIERHPRRFTALHLKDVAASNQPNMLAHQDSAEVGSGVIDWKTLLPAARRAGIRHYFVEQEPPFKRPPLEALQMSFDYLSKLEGA